MKAGHAPWQTTHKLEKEFKCKCKKYAPVSLVRLWRKAPHSDAFKLAVDVERRLA